MGSSDGSVMNRDWGKFEGGAGAIREKADRAAADSSGTDRRGDARRS